MVGFLTSSEGMDLEMGFGDGGWVRLDGVDLMVFWGLGISGAVGDWMESI